MKSPEGRVPSFQSFAIVPAAGHSTRMGRPKLLLPWGEGALIDHLLDVWRATDVNRILVVVRGDDRALAERVVGERVERVTPAVDPPDMKASIQAALQRIEERFRPNAEDVWLMAPADLPYLSCSVVNRLLASHNVDWPRILIPTMEGRSGHPVLMPWERATDVFSLAADQGVRDLFSRFPCERIEFGQPTNGKSDGSRDAATNAPSNEAGTQRRVPSLWQFQLDLDTPSDYARALQREKGRELH